MLERFAPFNRRLAAVLFVGLLLAADLGFAHGGDPGGGPDPGDSTVTHGDLAETEAPPIHRSRTFPRLGSIALNLTPCLHNSGAEIAKGFTCEHDLYSAYLAAHENGDHWGNAYAQFNQYFVDKFLNEQDRYLAMGIEDWTELRDVYLKAHGASEPLINALCGAWKPLQNTLEGPANLTKLPLTIATNWKSLCRFSPFYRESPWFQSEIHEGAPHVDDPAGHDAGDAYLDAGEDVMDAMDLTHETHGHLGPHGLDFNTETNWVYTALSHQGKVAIINLNVVDWGKVATYEEETGFRVLLFDEESVFKPESILYYASDLLLKARGDEERVIESLDAIHRYCFDAQADYLKYPRPWEDNLDFPSHLDPRLRDAIQFVRNLTDPPALAPGTVPPNRAGWACFLAFTGIDARPWTDPAFTNPFCAFDTRHLARYDSLHSPGLYSRSNPNRLGEGDAWRCDWFIRYIEVTSDIEVKVRRRMPDIGVPTDLPVVKDHAGMVEETVFDPELPELPPTGVVDANEEWIQLTLNVSIGPHDLVYNPVNGLLYVTHYWQLNDPDVRLLADWHIHVINGNPASPSFHNPYNTRGGPPALSQNGAPAGSFIIDDEPFPVDVGGPVDGLHPTTVDVDVRNGRVFVVNRESNTISVLYHDGSHDFAKNRLDAMLSGPERFGLTMDPANFDAKARDFSLYRDPDATALPTPEQVQGYFQVNPDVTTEDCNAFNLFLLEDANTSFAKKLCDLGILGALDLDAGETRDLMKPEVEGILRRLLAEETPWLDLLADVRALADVDAGSFQDAAEGFRATWLPRLTSAGDRNFLEGNLRDLEALSAPARAAALPVFFAHAEARLPGDLEAFMNDALSIADEIPRLEADPGAIRLALDALEAEWSDGAVSGALVGFEGASVEIGKVTAELRFVEPLVSASFLTGTPTWLAYCLAYSADDWLYHFLVEGEDPWDARGKEADNGKHPFHCDDVDRIHYPDPTPIQVDYAGRSNNHHVLIVREPIGAMLLDYWWEARPRLLQPFDIWINPGDGNIYVSNLGNHDNAPLMRGWITLIQEGGRAPCHRDDMTPGAQKIWPGLPMLRDKLPKLSCLIPRPNTGYQANLMLTMDLMPHHLNVNPYTFEVYGGHLLSDYIMAGQFERERISWTIPKAHVAGSDTVPGSSLVPMPNPTGMAVNPSSQRVFMTHFQDSKKHFVPLTGRFEDMTRYTGVMDIRNYTLVNDMVYAGDHHAVVDQNRPPGFRNYDEPFYNRTQTLDVNGRLVTGNPVVVGDTGRTLSLFHRCTYYYAVAKVDRDILGFAELPDGEHALVRKPFETLSPEEMQNLTSNATVSVLSPFDAGRCYNLFDLSTQIENWTAIQTRSEGNREAHVSPLFNGTVGEGPLLNLTMVAEFGEEYLTFGFLNLFFDPDNVPPGLRVTSPRMRDTDRFVGATLQASEELASAWLEADTPTRAEVPQGSLVMQVPGGLAPPGSGPWKLAFDTAYAVEWNGPPRTSDPDRMNVTVHTRVPGQGNTTVPVTMEVANWSARTACCPTWRETRIPLGQVTDWANTTLAFAFDSVDGVNNRHSGWSIAGVRIEDAAPNGNVSTYSFENPEALDNYRQSGLVANVTVVVNGDAVKALAFQNKTTRTYEVPDGRANGTFSFNAAGPGFNDANDTHPLHGVTDPVLVILHRQDVEERERLERSRKPYDQMHVEASVDGGRTWRSVWSRDSRNLPTPFFEAQSVDVTPLIEYANGEWADRNLPYWESKAYHVPEDVLALRPVQFRFRFDAMDPAFNALPGWAVTGIRLVGGVSAVTLEPQGGHASLDNLDGIPAYPGDTPRWWHRDGVYRFQNRLGTYESVGSGEGGANGIACRLDHDWFGGWSGGLFRGPGSGALTFVARDLAGNVAELTHTDGRGTLLVEDTFETSGWTENYWRREEMDPAGVGYPAYVFDPTPDGMGDLQPEDSPLRLSDGSVSAYVRPGVGEVVKDRRGILFEGRPMNFISEVDPPLLTEMAALVTDGPEYRRGFVVTAGDSDMERIPEDLRRVLEAEEIWLNVSHIARMDEPEPVVLTLTEVQDVLGALLGETPVGDVIDPVLGESPVGDGELDLTAILEETLQTTRTLAQFKQWGLRDAPPDTYILDGTPDVPVVAGERLSHTFRYVQEETEPAGADFSFDFVARHRFEGYPVWTKPFLTRSLLEGTLDPGLLDWLLNNVTLEKVRFTHNELEEVVGPLPLLDDVVNDTAWLVNHTLADLGLTRDRLLDLLLSVPEDLLAVQVPVSEILNDQDRLQMILPTFGEGYAVTVKLVNTTGAEHVIAERDGVTLIPDKIDFTPGEARGDVRITLQPDAANGTLKARLGMDVGRFEKLRVHFNETEAKRLLDKSGNYTLVVETRIRSGDAPSPGVVYEVVYGDLQLGVTTRPRPGSGPDANERPDPAFSWEGPVAPGARVTFHPGFATPAVGNAQDQDGYVRHYSWTFPAEAVTGVFLNGRAVGLDADDSAVDDLFTNVLATQYGKVAQNLTLREVTRGAERFLVLEFSAHGCVVPVPSATFKSKGDFPVTLRVRDDRSAEDALTQWVRVGGSNRAPEFVIDPVQGPDGSTRLLWQNNTGSLFLEARGRSMRIVEILKNASANLTELAKLDPKNLSLHVNFTRTTELTRSQLENGTRLARDLINATLRNPASLPDVVDDLLLVRPGIARAVTQKAEDATEGARMQIHLGKMPDPAIVSIPALGILLGEDPRLSSAAEVGRYALNGGGIVDLNLDPADLCDPDKIVNDLDLCAPELEDVEKLLFEGLLDAWVFRYAIHPDVNGTADLNRTIAQITIMDTGVGLVYFVTLDAVDDVIRIEKDLFGILTRSLDNITGHLDGVVPVSPYVAVATRLKEEADNLANGVLDRVTVEAALGLAPDVPLPDVEGLEIVRNLTRTDFDDRNRTLDDLEAIIDGAHAAVLAYADELNNTVMEQDAAARAQADLWAANAFTEVSLAPVKEGGRARVQANASVDFENAKLLSEEAHAAARRALGDLRNATNATTAWAANWTDTLASLNRTEILAKVDETRENVTLIVRDVLDLVHEIYKLLRKPIRDIVEDEADVEATIFQSAHNLPLTLGYDHGTGEAFARAGDMVVARGEVNPANRSAKIHASLSFSSIARHSMEVQAMWAGEGSTLYDGFNRDAPTLPADRFLVENLGQNRTTSNASTRIVAQPEATSHQYVWLTRSAEGPLAEYYWKTGGDGCGSGGGGLVSALRATGDALLSTLGFDDLSDSVFGSLGTSAPGGMVNRHRFKSDARASPPGACATGMIDTYVLTKEAGHPKAALAALSPEVAAVMDQPFGYTAEVHVAPGALQEFRVADGSRLHRLKSAPAVHAPHGPPPAPFIFDARAQRGPGLAEKVQVAFQPVGVANPRVSHYEVYVAPRPDAAPNLTAGEATYLGSVDPTVRPAFLTPELTEAGWDVPRDFLAFETTFDPDNATTGAFVRDWRYFIVRAVNKDGLTGPFSTPYRLPPTLLEEDFGLHRLGELVNGTGYKVDKETGEIAVGLLDLARVKVDTCLGDSVEVTRYTNFPHDEIAARWARSLRVHERGLDSLFWLLRALNQTLNEIPLDFGVLDVPLVDIDWDKCPSLRSLIEEANDLTDIGELLNTTETTVLTALNLTSDPKLPPLNPVDLTPAGRDLRLLHAVSNLTRTILGNQSLNLSLEDVLKGTPAQVTWRTENVSGPYHARARFMLPGPQIGPLTADTPIDDLLPSLNLGLFSALLPGERFHLLQVGHVDGKGNFTEVARVDLDPHLLAPLDVEGTASFIDGVLSLKEDPLGALATMDLPLSYGIAAGDTLTNRETVAKAKIDHWHTVEIYAANATADVYSVAFDGRFVAQLRTSNKTLTPNALRIGGSSAPAEVLFDDVRLMNAIHPPAPVVTAVKAGENFDFATIRWHMPEDGGAPLSDFNLYRVDLDERELDDPAAPAEIVATAGGGHVRFLTDPDSHRQPVGKRFAYAVQAVNEANGNRNNNESGTRNVGPLSDAHGVVLPGFLRVSAEASIAHNHQMDVADHEGFEGQVALPAGGIGRYTWRSVFHVNASQVTDARGRYVDPAEMGSATFLAYALDTQEASDGPFHILPTLEDVLRTLGYSEDLVAKANGVTTIHSVAEAADYLDLVAPGATDYLRTNYGEGTYYEVLEGFVESTRVGVIECPSTVPELLGHGWACFPATPEPLVMTSMCDDASRDLEMRQVPFNCWEDAISAFVSPGTDYSVEDLTWANQPRTEYWLQDTGVARQTTRDEAWRRYELLPALLRDGDGDLTVVLKKEKDHAPSASVFYAGTEAGRWVDEVVGPAGRGPRAPLLPWADRAGPDTFPWMSHTLSSGDRAVKIEGRAGVSSFKFAPSGVATVPFDVPIKMDVFIPEGEAPREIGMKLSANVVTRSGVSGGRDCAGVYGGGPGTALVTWGDELVRLKGGALAIEEAGELDYGADLSTPVEKFTGLHVAGVPPQRGRWVTLTFDPGQLALELQAQKTREDRALLDGLLHQLLDLEPGEDPLEVAGLIQTRDVLTLLERLRGPDTSRWLPEHLANAAAIYERTRPTAFEERVDHVLEFPRILTDYVYLVVPWKFVLQDFDKYVEPWHCGLSVSSVEVFAVGGDVYVDRIGPDVEPRIRVDAGQPRTLPGGEES